MNTRRDKQTRRMSKDVMNEPQRHVMRAYLRENNDRFQET